MVKKSAGITERLLVHWTPHRYEASKALLGVYQLKVLAGL